MKNVLWTVLALVMTSTPLSAVPISLFNTGVDGSGALLSGGAPDPHYTVLENGGAPAVVMTSIPGTFVPNGPNSRWIWQNANGLPVFVTRTFRTMFDLTGLDSSTASIDGLWGTDNLGLDILINGTSTGNTNGTFTSLTPFSITSGFTAGINTLDFVVRDVGFISGFRAEYITAEAQPPISEPIIPEPTTLSLFGLGTAGLVAITRRRKK